MIDLSGARFGYKINFVILRYTAKLNYFGPKYKFSYLYYIINKIFKREEGDGQYTGNEKLKAHRV
jgi:hypothetical protein